MGCCKPSNSLVKLLLFSSFKVIYLFENKEKLKEKKNSQFKYSNLGPKWAWDHLINFFKCLYFYFIALKLQNKYLKGILFNFPEFSRNIYKKKEVIL